ncbi:MAG: cofactor-independent phosphoglycerate mutase [Oscillospiraceae bacterium]|nr:cofactor-independent phosphoglycerate mutase [Oscillospiraceae bacterium]
MNNKQKIAVIIPDGMADMKLPELGNKTPMEVADKPCMDFLAQNGICGMVECIPDGMISDASANANLAILGYDPKIYSNGRSPLEAANIGLELRKNDTAFRCNLITVGDGALDAPDIYENKIIIDHSADEISTEDADILIKFLDKELGTDKIRFHTVKSYRHCLLWENCPEYKDFTGPHDILNKQTKEYLPSDDYLDLMKKSYDILNNHPLNIKRRENNKRPANSIWLWSPGTKPDMPDFKSKTGLDGSVIAAVDLIQGLGIYAGMNVIQVDGATGNYHTNYKNKGLGAIKEFENGKDFVFVHIEAPDECGHRKEIENKIKSIEKIDNMIIKPIYDYLNANFDDFKIIILPDHPTMLSTGAHSYDPVPFLIYKKGSRNKSGIDNFNEESVSEKDGIFIQNGYELLDFIMEI